MNMFLQKDYLTHIWDRHAGEYMIQESMNKSKGALAFIDLDNLKYVNDIFGHLSGDLSLKIVSQVISELSDTGIATRIGGDEFLLFLPEINREEAEREMEKLIVQFNRAKKPFMQETSLSIGLYMTKKEETIQEAMGKADKALYHVKQNGKDGYYVYMNLNSQNLHEPSIHLKDLISSLTQEGQYTGAYNVNRRAFAQIYHLIASMAQRYDYPLTLVLISLEPLTSLPFSITKTELMQACLTHSLSHTLRSVDVSTRLSASVQLVILNHADPHYIEKIMMRIKASFQESYPDNDVFLYYEYQLLQNACPQRDEKNHE